MSISDEFNALYLRLVATNIDVYSQPVNGDEIKAHSENKSFIVLELYDFQNLVTTSQHESEFIESGIIITVGELSGKTVVEQIAAQSQLAKTVKTVLNAANVKIIKNAPAGGNIVRKTKEAYITEIQGII